MVRIGYASVIVTIDARVKVHGGDLNVRCAFIPRLQVGVGDDAVSGAMKCEESGRPII